MVDIGRRSLAVSMTTLLSTALQRNSSMPWSSINNIPEPLEQAIGGLLAQAQNSATHWESVIFERGDFADPKVRNGSICDSGRCRLSARSGHRANSIKSCGRLIPPASYESAHRTRVSCL